MIKHQSNTELIQVYIRTAWVLKIRLMSARRHLWNEKTSFIHIETALLQIRKICENIGYLCVIAAEFEQTQHLSKLRKEYRVGKLFKLLEQNNMLIFPQRARLTKKDIHGEQTTWELRVETDKQDDRHRVSNIHNQCGNQLHEKSPFIKWPSTQDEAKNIVFEVLNSVRNDHQWLWNRFWQHAITLRGTLFFVNLGEMMQASQPMFIREEGLPVKDITVDFDPDFLADFSG